MNPVNVLCTSTGNDGFQAVLGGLRKDPAIRVLAVDSSRDTYGLHLADKGFVVATRSEEDELINQLNEIILQEKVDILLPLSTEDQEFYSAHKIRIEKAGCKIAVSTHDAINTTNNKHKLFQTLKKGLKKYLPEFYLASSRDDVLRLTDKFFTLQDDFVVKRKYSTGAQGVKIVSAKLKPEDKFFSRDNIRITLKEFLEWVNSIEHVPELLISEYLPGTHVSVDCFYDGNTLYGLPRTEEKHLYGMGRSGITVNNSEIMDASLTILKELGLRYVNNIEFKEDRNGTFKLMEINPRFPASIDHTIKAGLNLPLIVVNYLLGKEIKKSKIQYGLKYFKYWTSISSSDQFAYH